MAHDGVRTGRLETIDVRSEAFGDTRQVPVYVPARYRPTRRYPLLIVHDGVDFVRFADLKDVLDNLIDRLEIPPVIAALTQAQDRLIEYAGDDRHGRFLAEELLPAMEDRYPLHRDPSRRALMGASFGGVASLSAAWLHPGIFDKLLLLSGSFAFSDIGSHSRGPVFRPGRRVHEPVP